MHKFHAVQVNYGKQGAWLAGGALAAYLYGLARYGRGPRSGGLAFNALTLGQLLHALSCRSSGRGALRLGDRANLLNKAIGGSIALQACVNLLPPLRKILNMEQGMSILDLLVILGGAGLPLLANEAAKKN